MMNFITVKVVAKHFGRTEDAVRKWLQAGRIPGEKINPRLWLIPRLVLSGEFEVPKRGRPPIARELVEE